MCPSSWKARMRWSGIAVAEVDVGRGDVDAELHPQRPAELSFASRPPSGRTLDGVTGELSDAHGRGEPTVTISRLLVPRSARKPKPAKPPAQDPQAPPARVLVLILFVLGMASFALRAGHRRSRARSRRSTPRGHRPAGRRLHLRRRRAHACSPCCAARESRMIVASDEISERMKQAIVAIEDKRFYEHRGVDLRGDRRAPSGRTSATERSSRAARRSRSSSSRTRTSEPAAVGRAEAEGGGARLAARAALVEGPDPDRLPQHDLLRERRLRDRAGGARRTSTTSADRPDAGRGGAARRASRATRRCYDPVANPQAARARREHRPPRRCSTRATSPGASTGGAIRAPLPQPAGRAPPGQAGPGAVLHQLRQAAADRPLRRGHASSAAGSGCHTTIDLELQKLARQAISKMADRSATGRRRRSWRSTRATARCSR